MAITIQCPICITMRHLTSNYQWLIWANSAKKQNIWHMCVCNGKWDILIASQTILTKFQTCKFKVVSHYKECDMCKIMNRRTKALQMVMLSPGKQLYYLRLWWWFLRQKYDAELSWQIYYHHDHWYILLIIINSRKINATSNWKTLPMEKKIHHYD